MLKEVKEKIENLYQQGKKGVEIATELNISYNTVKSYLRRKKLKTGANKEVVKGTCLTCGKELTQTVGKRHKSFCCDYCRVKYWRSKCKNKNVEMN